MWGQLLAITWRVKKWKLSGSMSGSFVITPVPFPPVTWSFGVTVTEGFVYNLWGFPTATHAATKEKQLVSNIFGPYAGLSNRELELIHSADGADASEITDSPVLNYSWNNSAGASGSSAQTMFATDVLTNG
jgi:hypothetical protein